MKEFKGTQYVSDTLKLLKKQKTTKRLLTNHFTYMSYSGDAFASIPIHKYLYIGFI